MKMLFSFYGFLYWGIRHFFPHLEKRTTMRHAQALMATKTTLLPGILLLQWKGAHAASFAGSFLLYVIPVFVGVMILIRLLIQLGKFEQKINEQEQNGMSYLQIPLGKRILLAYLSLTMVAVFIGITFIY